MTSADIIHEIGQVLTSIEDRAVHPEKHAISVPGGYPRYPSPLAPESRVSARLLIAERLMIRARTLIQEASQDVADQAAAKRDLQPVVVCLNCETELVFSRCPNGDCSWHKARP